MKKINLKGISEILSEKELKNVIGGIEAAKRYTCCCGMGATNNCSQIAASSAAAAVVAFMDLGNCSFGGGCFM